MCGRQDARAVQVALAMLRDMSALAPFSLLADCAHVIGMLVVLKDDVENYSRAHETVVASRGPGALPFLFGVVIYCYEGISMILPIQDAMKDKTKVRPVGSAFASQSSAASAFWRGVRVRWRCTSPHPSHASACVVGNAPCG